MNEYITWTVCPVCGSVRRVNKNGAIRKHMRNTSARVGARTIYGNEWCAGGGQPAVQALDADECPTCRRTFDLSPGLGGDGNPRCDRIDSHRCGSPSREGGECVRGWGHSAYDSIGHTSDPSLDVLRGGK